MNKQDFIDTVPTGAGITPHDLRTAEFRRTLRGHDPTQVADLLHRAGTEIEILLTERDELTERLQTIESADTENQRQIRDLENLLQTHERRTKQNEQVLTEKEEKIQALILEKSRVPSADSLATLTADLANAKLENQQLTTVIKNKDETLAAFKEKLKNTDQAESEHQRLSDALVGKDEAISQLKAELESSRQTPPATGILSIPDMLASALASVEDVLSATQQFLSQEANTIIKDAELEAAAIREAVAAESHVQRKELEAAALTAEKQMLEYSQFLERQMRALSSLHTQKNKDS